jgi:hypothetical protein
VSESFIELIPKIPVCEVAEALWAVLREVPRPTRLEHFLREWLPSLQVTGGLQKVEQLRLRVFGQVLLDLTSQGWLFAGNGEVGEVGMLLRATPPDTTHRATTTEERRAPSDVKGTLRQGLVANRDEQLRDPTVRAFVQRMEQLRRYRGQRVSVRSLLASPMQWVADIRGALAASEASRAEQLAGLVQPYLQLASELPDEHTGLRLLDVWRYCRYTWSLPFQTQPGRRMFYLVRDASRAFHPIIGIAALGSAVVQISVRDHAIGWSLDALADKDEPQAQAAHLPKRAAQVAAYWRELETAVQEIYRDDLLEEGVLTEAECVNPTLDTLARLEAAVDLDYRGSRERRAHKTDLEDEARSPMFRKKRVQVLEELLSARLEFNKYTALDNEGQYQQLIKYAEGRRALRMAMRSIKKRHVAASLMEITTCGAIPPYGPLLGGKLVAMLMASPQVVKDYRERYGTFKSVIASRMRGADLVRNANLVLLGTTSLYHVGSSQYNRIRFPGKSSDIKYQLLGKTAGYGSVHLSQKTYDTIQELLKAEDTSQSYTFAAGVNYKLRSMAAALSMLGLQKLQQHATPRLVYAVPTAENWQEYLTGQDTEPRWHFQDIDNPSAETDQIIEFWKQRWFVNRVQRPETLAHLQAIEPPLTILLPKIAVPTPAYSESTLFFLGPDKYPMISWSTFAEFDNGRLSFAEKQTEDEAKTIHISSPKLEEGILALLEQGHRVYLTGNPGDGKTHLLQHLEGMPSWPAGTYIELDASAVAENKLVAGLTEAAAAGKPALVAVNEGPLRQMLSRLPDAEELKEQLDRPFWYEGETLPEVASKAVLVQLGSRQVLHPSLVNDAVNLALTRVEYTGAPPAVQANVKALKHERVRKRLTELLAEVGRGGIHVTVHQLLGLLARIITGGQADTAEQAPPYYESLFKLPVGSSPLATELRELDPAYLTHALLDTTELWDAPTKAGPWLPDSKPAVGAPGELGITSDEARLRFERLKRQHYFEAEYGEKILVSLPDDRLTFNNLLSGPASQAAKIILKALIRFAGQVPDAELSLPLWTSLRYDADQPAWAKVAGTTLLPANWLVRRPMLPKPASQLLHYQPDHLLLTLATKPYPDGPALLLDLPLWQALNAVARGLPVSSRDEDAGRRVDNFLAAAAAALPSTSEYLRIYNNRDNHETKVQVVLDASAPAGASYLL